MTMRLFAVLVALLAASTAQAGLISVSGPASSDGVLAAIIAAPADVDDDAAENEAQEALETEIKALTTELDEPDGG